MFDWHNSLGTAHPPSEGVPTTPNWPPSSEGARAVTPLLPLSSLLTDSLLLQRRGWQRAGLPLSASPSLSERHSLSPCKGSLVQTHTLAAKRWYTMK